MTVKNDGGPAFPVPAETWNLTGMSLRDYFAIHASEKDIEAIRFGFSDMSRSEARYIYADEMLEAREEK